MGIPQSPPEEKDGALKTVWSDWQDSDTGRDKVEARWRFTHTSTPTDFLAVWSNLEETMVRACRERVVSLSYMECLRHGAQTQFSPKEAMYKG